MPDFSAPDPARESLGQAARGFVGEIVRVLVVSLVIVFVVRHFLVQPFYVKGASMEPAFEDHEYLIIDELTYRFQPIARGDVVVFRPPGANREHYIKRVIGLPGETITVRDGRVYVASSSTSRYALDETAYLGALQTPYAVSVTLGPDQYFLMGDNRPASLDSRSFGAVHRDRIVGRAWIRGWPPARVGVLTRPVYTP